MVFGSSLSTVYLEAGISNWKLQTVLFPSFLSRIKQDWKLLVWTVAQRLPKISFPLFQIHHRYAWPAALLLLCLSTCCPVIADNKHKKWVTKLGCISCGFDILEHLSMQLKRQIQGRHCKKPVTYSQGTWTICQACGRMLRDLNASCWILIPYFRLIFFSSQFCQHFSSEVTSLGTCIHHLLSLALFLEHTCWAEK